MPRKVFVAGEILTASEVNTNLMDQSVMVFDDATARTTAIPTPVEGMVTYLEDVGGAQGLEVFDGSVFTPVAIEPDPPAILQVVSVTNQTQAVTTSGTYQISGLSASITPTSASNKILVLVHSHVSHDSTTANGIYTIFRGTVSGTNLGTGIEGMTQIYNAGGGSTKATAALNFLDSPATTSAVTYTLGFRGNGGTNVYAQRNNSLGSMTLMEVSG